MTNRERWILTLFLFLLLCVVYYLNCAEQDAPLKVLIERHVGGCDAQDTACEKRQATLQKLKKDLATIAFDCYTISKDAHPVLDGVTQRYIEPLEVCVSNHMDESADAHARNRLAILRVNNQAIAADVHAPPA